MKYTIASVWSWPTEDDLNRQQHISYTDLELDRLLYYLEYVHKWHTGNADHNKYIRETNNRGPGGVARVPDCECIALFVIEGGDKPGVCSYDPNNLAPVITRLGCRTL